MVICSVKMCPLIFLGMILIPITLIFCSIGFMKPVVWPDLPTHSPCLLHFPWHALGYEHHDPGLIDFIEIINNAHPMIPDNYQAIQWWIHLSCSGFPIAPVSGLDLHGPMDLSGVFTTFIETEDNFSRFQNASQLLAQAIRRCRTCVTRGPVLHWTLSGETLTLSLLPGLTPVPIQEPETEASFFCIIKTEKDSLVIPIGNKDCHVSLPYTIRSSKGAVLLLFPAESFHSEHWIFPI